jgi:hypothetical protein
MKALGAWIDNHENLLANVFSFVMTFLLLWAVAAGTNTVQANDVTGSKPPFTEDVFVFSRDAKGTWVYRSAKIKQFANTFPVICFELPKRTLVQCFYANGNGTGALDDAELVGEKRT